jgi:hypothetical protein
MSEMNDYPTEAKCVSPLLSYDESTKERLEKQKRFFVDKIKDIDEALGLLNKYPDIEKLTDLLRKI